MGVTFFADDPDPLDLAAVEEPVRDPRHGPAEDELPAVIGYGLRWATSEHAAIVVESARVFTDGVLFQIGRQVRRRDLSERQFQQLIHEDHFFVSEEGRRARLQYGAILSDGQRLADSDLFDEDGVDDGAVLLRQGGSGGGGASSYRYADDLWLHPLPPAGSLELVVQWPALQVPEHRITLPVGDLLRAAEQVTTLWSD
ncbi:MULTISPECIES: hypothetical protein [unclassified Curtobacterium]|uniref:hypothetical protein n=1 Tax=unclassified Curtobacterium TaxID=257496 RepID=UPI00188C6019|nr:MULTISPECIES: hypothetical protein [unclassified Curtobacterium]MBF4591733.1 hypothetical protein [Curtobacterium sp. VKM Ac-1395]MCY1692942.1 hypothetical protein [Curtobacterium sp. SL109]